MVWEKQMDYDVNKFLYCRSNFTSGTTGMINFNSNSQASWVHGESTPSSTCQPKYDFQLPLYLPFTNLFVAKK